MPLIVVIGPPGAGKSTLVDRFLTQHPRASLHRSVTTRLPRGTADTSHTFVGEDEFDVLIKSGKLMPAAEAYGFRYALPFPPRNPTNPLFILIRHQFVAPFRALYPEAGVIQIEAPAPILIGRLANRSDKYRENIAAIQAEIGAGRLVADVCIDSHGDPDETYYLFEAACMKVAE